MQVTDAAVVGSEEDGGSRGDDGNLAIGTGESVDGFERMPNGENDDFEFRTGEFAREELGANETAD